MRCIEIWQREVGDCGGIGLTLTWDVLKLNTKCQSQLLVTRLTLTWDVLK